ncbi:substrate-binding domain-containing protein [Ruminococcus sp.]|uniref:substrate-binding domain-containing protein n=1 Tax=Ruminococcus sp. TaxID=41978 RepID=UPI0025D9BA6E|nr:substrate-binding domain-containing protein [Ruminococcus sp.]MBQ8967178.1 substrate-binding domain-containing protein [Ruminococcus sp.]
MKWNKRIVDRAAIGALAFAMVMTSGCGAKKEESHGQITVIVKSQDPYWDSVKKGADEAADELGYTIDWQAPENENIAQNSYVETAVHNGTKAILVAPSVADGLDDSFKMAADSEIPILAIDTDIDSEYKESCLATNQDAAGGIAARETLQLLPQGGQIAVMGHMQDSPTAIGRFGGYFANLPHTNTTGFSLPAGYDDSTVLDEETGAGLARTGTPVFDLVDIRFCDNNADVAVDETKAMLEAHPDIKVIYCTNQTSTVGVGRAINELGYKEQVQVVGFDSSDEEIDFVQKGVLDGIVVQNPYNMGYLGVRYAVKSINGYSIPSGIDTGATFVTKDNLENPEVQMLLHPENY